MSEQIMNFVEQMGFYKLFAEFPTYWGNLVMILVLIKYLFSFPLPVLLCAYIYLPTPRTSMVT